MNRARIISLLEQHYDVAEHKRNKVMIELLEALLDEDYDENLGRTASSED